MFYTSQSYTYTTERMEIKYVENCEGCVCVRVCRTHCLTDLQHTKHPIPENVKMKKKQTHKWGIRI